MNFDEQIALSTAYRSIPVNLVLEAVPINSLPFYISQEVPAGRNCSLHHFQLMELTPHFQSPTIYFFPPSIMAATPSIYGES